jgi:transcriptional regulator with XRE-family HTH domain
MAPMERTIVVVDQVGPAVGRRRLGIELRRHRTAAGKTMRQVADHLDCSAGKISRLEAGLVAPNVSDVRVMLDYYGVPGFERDALVAVARQAREKAWWNDYLDVVPPGSARFFGLEDGATAIKEYSLGLVPGLLQTVEYVRALTRCASDADSAKDERRVELRLRRQELLRRSDPPQLHVVMNQTVLYDPVGGDLAASRQLAYLAEVAELPNVTLQVLPTNVGAHRAKDERFSILRFRDPADREIVYLEQPMSNAYLDGADHLGYYSGAFDQISELALIPDESRKAVRDAADLMAR